MGNAGSLQYELRGIQPAMCTRTISGLSLRLNNPSTLAVMFKQITVGIEVYGRKAGETIDSLQFPFQTSVLDEIEEPFTYITIPAGSFKDYSLSVFHNGGVYSFPSNIASAYIHLFIQVAGSYGDPVLMNYIDFPRTYFVSGLTLQAVPSVVNACIGGNIYLQYSSTGITRWTTTVGSTTYTNNETNPMIPAQPAGTYSCTLQGGYDTCVTPAVPFTLNVQNPPTITLTSPTTYVYGNDGLVTILYSGVTGGANHYSLHISGVEREAGALFGDGQIEIPSNTFYGVSSTTVEIFVSNATCQSSPVQHEIRWQEFP